MLTTPILYDFYNYPRDEPQYGLLLNEFLQVCTKSLLCTCFSSLSVCLPCENYEFWVCNFFAEHSTLWCIAFLHRDEELNSEEATEEEDSQNKDSLDILKKEKRKKV